LFHRYSIGQITGVIFVTAGVVWATLDNASAHTEVKALKKTD
jgi:UDP-xylose/UDP-N-acetylglucosamine transporter B4